VAIRGGTLGGTKRLLEELTEGGLDLVDIQDKNVCADCFEDAGLSAFVAARADADECDFCGKTNTDAATLVDVVKHIDACLAEEYEDASALPYETAEGGYQGTTYDADDLVCQLIEFSEESGELAGAIAQALGDRQWCERDPFALRRDEQLQLSWEAFVSYVSHEARFLALSGTPEYADDHESLSPERMLATVARLAENAGLVILLQPGQELFRVRVLREGVAIAGVRDLGAPRPEECRISNRMSPPGIAMTYLAFEPDTASAEMGGARSAETTVVMARFKLAERLRVLDLSNTPPVPGFFEEIPDSSEVFAKRRELMFLEAFTKDVSKPIEHDDRVHIEYVPTQVVTEYFREHISARDGGIAGIMYRSSCAPNGTCLVLFGGQELLVVDDDVEGSSSQTRARRIARCVELVEWHEL